MERCIYVANIFLILDSSGLTVISTTLRLKKIVIRPSIAPLNVFRTLVSIFKLAIVNIITLESILLLIK